ncbi:unnamed protein product [Schistosoma turkestanicum]|nr:unnamed protein product [Schistosoma turkestanicum]
MRIKVLLEFLLKIIMILIIIIVNNLKIVTTQSWQTTLRLAKRHTHHYDIDILKTAIDNYAFQMNRRRTTNLDNVTIHDYEKNFTNFNAELDNTELALVNYSSDTNTLVDYLQENNYFSDQTMKNSKNTNFKNSLFTQVHSVSTTLFTWNLLQFLFGLLCFIIHVTWFIWLICHAILLKIHQNTMISNAEMISHSNLGEIIGCDLLVKHYQLKMHAELHLGFVGTIYGFIISIRQLSSFFIDHKSTTSLDQSSLIHRNYLLCYFTRNILLGLLTVYWITIFIIILINIHYVKSIYYMNTIKIPLVSNIIVILYISFITSWIFSIVIRMGSLLINNNLQRFTLKHLTDSNHASTKQLLNFECMNTKNLEHQKLYFHTVCNRTTFEQWLEIIINVLSDILPNFLVFSVSIFNCFISFKSQNNSAKRLNPYEQTMKHLTCNKMNNNNNENTMKFDNFSKELTCSPEINKNTTEMYTASTSSCLTYQCDLLPTQRKYQSEDNILYKQTSQLNASQKLYQIIYFSICLMILSLCLLIAHFLRLIIYGNLMRSQVNYCGSWNFNQGLNEPENIQLFKLVHENLHIPHQHLQGCILAEIFITTFVPIVCFVLRRCHTIFYTSCFKIHQSNNLERTLSDEVYKEKSEFLCNKSIKTDYSNVSKLAVPIGSYISSTTTDDPGTQSTITASLSSTTQCCQSSTDTIIPPCELLKLQMFTRAQFEQKPQINESPLKTTYTSFPIYTKEVPEQQTSTTFVPVSIKLVNLQPLCCQPCDLFTGGTKIESKPDDNVIECEYLSNSCIYPIGNTASVVKLHVVSDSSGYDES